VEDLQEKRVSRSHFKVFTAIWTSQVARGEPLVSALSTKGTSAFRALLGTDQDVFAD